MLRWKAGTVSHMRIDAAPPFFGALHALAIDDGGGGARFSFRLLAAFDIEHVMNEIQHAIALPPDEVVVDRAVRRKILRKVAPLATRAQLDFGQKFNGLAMV